MGVVLASADLTGADQILVEQTEIGHDPHGHPVIDRGLEFQEEVDIEPILAPAQLPDDVIGPVPEIVADIYSERVSS